MVNNTSIGENYVEAIRRSNLTIYDYISPDDESLYIPEPELEQLLSSRLVGLSLDLPLRTRSKLVKSMVCEALGYSAPKAFKRTKPRFIGQNLDIYVQKANNLQIWNEDISLDRRYAIVRVSSDYQISRVKVVSGAILAEFDTTGTLTAKYQARLTVGESIAELIAEEDTDQIRRWVTPGYSPDSDIQPTDLPQPGALAPIAEIFEKLHLLVDRRIVEAGLDQERNRGGALHQLVCRSLGYSIYRDDGQFPDLSHQLLEVKLQTSPTIDLGIVRPDSKVHLGFPNVDGMSIRHCDVRYAIFNAESDGEFVTLKNLYLTTGERFFTRFPQFQGNVVNTKYQIPLPVDFFD